MAPRGKAIPGCDVPTCLAGLPAKPILSKRVVTGGFGSVGALRE